MKTKEPSSFAIRSKEENWLPVLELAVEEVFGIMLNAQVKPVPIADHTPSTEFTAMVGLAGSLCGILTVCCNAKTAGLVAKSMLGDTATSDEEIADALGEICNMIAGNFESGSAQMKSASTDTLDRIGSMLLQRDYGVRVEGYTDNVPIHNSQFPSNWELSASRSSEIVRLLIVRDRFPPERLSAAGFAEYHPVASNSTADGRSQNRRVDIVILGSPQISAPAAKPSPNAKIPTPPPSDKNTGNPQRLPEVHTP
jgi:hypothetical protein